MLGRIQARDDRKEFAWALANGEAGIRASDIAEQDGVGQG
jgi:hypothetical protein